MQKMKKEDHEVTNKLMSRVETPQPVVVGDNSIPPEPKVNQIRSKDKISGGISSIGMKSETSNTAKIAAADEAGIHKFAKPAGAKSKKGLGMLKGLPI